MAGKQRPVYFMEAVLWNPDGSVEEIEAGFWPSLHTWVADLPTARRFFTFYGNRYGGSAHTEGSLAEDYLYLGRRRQRSDFPDHAPDDDSDEVALDVPGNLVEPMYAVAVGGTNYAAFLRTSGGPSFEAFEHWVSHVLGLEKTGQLFELRPYVRQDALDRLAAADGVAKLNLKYDPDTLRSDQGPIHSIEGALKAIEDLGGGGVSIEIELSFGTARPSEIGAERYAQELQRALSTAGLTRARATLLTAKPAGKNGRPTCFAREKVNFLRDQVVHTVKMGESEADSRTPSLVLSAMAGAIAKFRTDIERDRPQEE
jgi:hypothetical protein